LLQVEKVEDTPGSVELGRSNRGKMGSERKTVAFGIRHENMRTIVGEESREEKIELASRMPMVEQEGGVKPIMDKATG
jgi:hypothetical protein